MLYIDIDFEWLGILLHILEVLCSNPGPVPAVLNCTFGALRKTFERTFGYYYNLGNCHLLTYFYYKHEMNAYTVDHICLSVGVIQLQKNWKNFDHTSNSCYAIVAILKSHFRTSNKR
jgi:hypothetical protein